MRHLTSKFFGGGGGGNTSIPSQLHDVRGASRMLSCSRGFYSGTAPCGSYTVLNNISAQEILRLDLCPVLKQ